MKKIILYLIVAMNVSATYGQITTTTISPRLQQTEVASYDSTINFLGKDVYNYIGQELYLKELPGDGPNDGYRDFIIDYTKSSSGRFNRYKCCGSYSRLSRYNALAGKYFTVLDVIKDTEDIYDSKYYLKLQEKQSKDILYFVYDNKYVTSFPFVVVGHYIKLKQTEVGKEYILRGKNWKKLGELMTDMTTGKPVSFFTPGAMWKCVDVTIEKENFNLALVLENDIGERIPLYADQLLSKEYRASTDWIIELKQAEIYIRDFGDENWQRILAGKVKIGMTKEMCVLSWGLPVSRNYTTTAEVISEQWVYRYGYLYFDNGVLTAIQ